MKKRVIILGSTGSVGRNTLAVLDAMLDDWHVVGLAAGANWRELARQAERYRPVAVGLQGEDDALHFREAVTDAPPVYCGEDALVDLVEAVPCDCVVVAVVGARGLQVTLCAARKGLRVALANKEAVVIGGELLTRAAAESGATIIPVDSEHSAIFQAMQAGRKAEVHGICLTASGGPFRTWDTEAMRKATVEDALRHPTWEMGPKITIDSATMMNKALEIVEARWLFDLDPDRIQVVVHPESIIHSWVEFCDGSIIAQLGAPDMRTPIQYALTYPQRRRGPADRLDLSQPTTLTLHPPDHERFPALELGYQAARRGGTCGAVLNAANEQAVRLFCDGAIALPEVTRLVERAMEQHRFKESPTLDDLLQADRWARDEVTRCTTC